MSGRIGTRGRNNQQGPKEEEEEGSSVSTFPIPPFCAKSSFSSGVLKDVRGKLLEREKKKEREYITTISSADGGGCGGSCLVHSSSTTKVGTAVFQAGKKFSPACPHLSNTAEGEEGVDKPFHFLIPAAATSLSPFSLLQKQAMLVRQLEEEVVKSRQHAKETNPEIKAHIEALQVENDHLTREIAILKETIKVSSNMAVCKFHYTSPCSLIGRLQSIFLAIIVVDTARPSPTIYYYVCCWCHSTSSMPATCAPRHKVAA